MRNSVREISIQLRCAQWRIVGRSGDARVVMAARANFRGSGIRKFGEERRL